MKIGIISDSHDHHKNVLAAVETFNHHQVKYVLHAGDIVSPFTAKCFAAIAPAQFIAVFGNNDGEKLLLQKAVAEINGQIHDNCYKGTLGNRQIFMTHSPYVIDELLASQKYDLVIHGHTHKTDVRRLGRTLLVNPGESTDWLSPEPHVVVLELDDMSYEILALA